ncbi:MAG: hypothetical protein KGL65_10660 [Rhodospirillales bacterium]|nr:hypothetical protein [Rhodospirillales bacterium]
MLEVVPDSGEVEVLTVSCAPATLMVSVVVCAETLLLPPEIVAELPKLCRETALPLPLLATVLLLL